MSEQPSAVRPWFCPQCGNSNASAASFCTRCGKANPISPSGNFEPGYSPIKPPPEYYQQVARPPQMQQYGTPYAPAQNPGYPVAPYIPKSRVIYILLAFFLGMFGVHNFYAGRNKQGVIQLLLTCLTFWLVVPLIAVWIWTVVEMITVERDARGFPMT